MTAVGIAPVSGSSRARFERSGSCSESWRCRSPRYPISSVEPGLVSAISSPEGHIECLTTGRLQGKSYSPSSQLNLRCVACGHSGRHKGPGFPLFNKGLRVTFDTSSRVSRRKPQVRNISGRSIVHAIAGPEQPYPVYQFSNRVFPERPNLNPFKNSDFAIITITPNFPSPVVGEVFAKQMEEEGSTGAVTWSVASGVLPDGLSMSNAGLISGTPTTTGLVTAQIRASDAGPPVNVADSRLSIQVNN